MRSKVGLAVVMMKNLQKTHFTSHYLTLNIPQYSEQNATHFRVKVGAPVKGTMIFGLNWSMRTIRPRPPMPILIAPDSDTHCQTHPLEIYMKPATSGATMGGLQFLQFIGVHRTQRVYGRGQTEL